MQTILKYKYLYIKLVFLIIIFLSAMPLHAGNITFSWDPPTTNTDGSLLNDLAGYKIYYGTDSGNYTQSVDIGNVSTYQINNLTDGLTYYFVITAYNSSANESAYSTEYVKTIVPPVSYAPEITVHDSISPDNDLQMPFGNIIEGSSTDRTLTITNVGNADLEIYSIAQADPLINEFIFLSDNCSGNTISPSSDCTLTVRFSPTTTDQLSDTFDIPSDDPDEDPVTVSVSGTGLSSATNNAPSTPILLSPENGQTDMGTAVQFRWEESSDPDGDNVTYSLHYCENGNFIGCTPIQIARIKNKAAYFANTGIEFLLFGIVCAGSIRGRRKIMLLSVIVIMSAIFLVSCGGGGSGSGPAAPDNEITQEISGLKTGTTYYWMVAADDGNGGRTESEKRSFTTQ